MALYLGNQKIVLYPGGAIDTGDATATSDKILEGYTAYVDGALVIGTLDPTMNVYATASVTP